MTTEKTQNRRAEPFVKWAGGKRNLLPKLLPYFPPRINGRYFEPFLGGGAVFFALRPERASLSDINEELVDVYTTVRNQALAVIDELATLGHNKATYYRVRRSRPADPIARAARFIYLNKTCFNGLFRVNLRGEFNVPYGRHGRNLLVCDKDQLLAASRALRNATIDAGDFAAVADEAEPGDLVYFDPPYTVAHTNNGFIEYNAKVFAWSDQRRLAEVARALREKGVQVVISNADHQSIVKLYEGFSMNRVGRKSTMAGSSENRRSTTELVIVSNGTSHHD